MRNALLISTLGIILVAILMTTSNARAEYRVYELLISNKATGSSRVYKSTLDDQQYAGYYLVQPGETVVIQATWMCRERSEFFKDFCPNPRLAANPAPITPPK